MPGMRSNAAQVADDVDDLRTALLDLTPAAEAAAAIALPLAVEQAPRLTGRLAASLRSVVVADGYAITSDLPYAAAVHARTPWLADIVVATSAEQVNAVEQYIDEHTP